jgi:2-methylisocitrate lyase-like PEP mutase family enzyme
MPATQFDKAEQFRQLHEGPAFVMPNAWDGGSAKALAKLGFDALATSSGAAAAVIGRRDGELSRDEALAHARLIASSTDLPVAGDLENGFGHAPADVMLTIRLAAEAGLVGGSIEDFSGDRDRPIYELEHATERVAAAVEAARALPFKFTLTARCENLLHGRPDLDDVIRRLQAFERAGADVLFAPGLPSLDAVHRVCAAVGKPVNFMIGKPGCSFSVEQLTQAGVRRVSLAATLYRAAMAAMVAAAKEVREHGTFGYVDRA